MVFRSDWKNAIISLLLTWVTLGIYGIYLWFGYNKMYIKELINKGFKAKGLDHGSIAEISAAIGQTIPEFMSQSSSEIQVTS